MGLTLGTVEKRPLTRNIRTSSRIVADETRLFRVTTKIDGWVDKLFISTTGQAVRQGDPLLTIYSPQLVSAQQEYLSVMQSAKALAAGGDLIVSGILATQAWEVFKAAAAEGLGFTQVIRKGKWVTARGGRGNPNGSLGDIAGICNERRNVLGMMPHPERLAEGVLGGDDGLRLFEGICEAIG